MEPSNNFLVYIKCRTYNQVNYITDAMDGFVMQQTNFPFVCTIVDDASTDGEQEVIKAYLKNYFDLQDASIAYEKNTDLGHVSFARHKTNRNCYFAVIFLNENHYSQKKPITPYLKEWEDNAKYMALCEGDDYWTDPLKLQRQVDFLEEHPDFSLCFHKVKVWKEKEGIMTDDFLTREVPQETELCDLAEGNYIHTLSVVYRNNERVGDFRTQLGNVIMGDYVCWMACAQYGKIWKMSECMAVYRYGSGIWSNKSLLIRLIETLSVLNRLYPLIDSLNAKNKLEEQIWSVKKTIISECNMLEEKYLSILNSHSFRLGEMLIKPYRWLKRIMYPRIESMS